MTSKTVLITGANRGIGFSLAEKFLEEGHSVIATAREPDKAADLNKLGAKYAGRLRIEALDVAQPSTITALGQKLASLSIDILVNNAGVLGPERQTPLDMDFDGFAEMLVINTLGPLRVTQALLPSLRKADGGAKVATISSRVGSMSYAKVEHIAYRASKSAVNKLMQGLAIELAPEKIAVHMLHPGWVRTDMGGPEADIDVTTSVNGLYRQITQLGMAETGSFTNYAGETIPW